MQESVDLPALIVASLHPHLINEQSARAFDGLLWLYLFIAIDPIHLRPSQRSIVVSLDVCSPSALEGAIEGQPHKQVRFACAHPASEEEGWGLSLCHQPAPLLHHLGKAAAHLIALEGEALCSGWQAHALDGFQLFVLDPTGAEPERAPA